MELEPLNSETGSDDDADTQPSVLLKLPNEIWSLVFSFVPYQDSAKLRVVSKWWRKTVDELSMVHVNSITDSKPRSIIKRIFELRVRSCGISNLSGPFEPKFQFPLLVKEITFGTNISAENMLKILSTCSNVESLCFFTTISSDVSFNPNSAECVRLLNQLKNLKSIEIVIHSFATRSPTTISPTFETLIGNAAVTFPAVSKLTLTFTIYHKEWVTLFNFIARHAATLTSLNIKYQCVANQVDKEEHISKMLATVNSMEKLSTTKLRSLIVQKDRNSCNCNLEEVWMAILTTQKSLEVVSTDLIPKLPIILDLVTLNVNTLKSVSFYDVFLELGDILDGSIFSQCNSLEVLQLLFIPAYVVMVDIRDVGKKPKLSNFEFTGLPLLPKSLVKLNLQGCEMSSSDLLEMSTRLHKLIELEFGSPGIAVCSNTNTGVTFEIFKNICTNFIDLRSLKLHKDIINMKSVTESGSNYFPMFSLWTKVIDSSRSLNVCGNTQDDVAVCCDNSIYEFSFNSTTRHLFVDSLVSLYSADKNS